MELIIISPRKDAMACSLEVTSGQKIYLKYPQVYIHY